MAIGLILPDSATSHAKPNDDRAILCMGSFNFI